MGEQEAAFKIRRLPDTREAWDVYDLAGIWRMVRDEDGNDNYAQAVAWHHMDRLCTEQADQLQKALDQLMVKWPPHPGSAAEAFKSNVDTLIASMRDSAAAAQANPGPLITITRLLSEAKDAIGQLITQRAANEQAEQDWIAANTDPFTPVPPSPLEPGWQQTLDRHARDIMHATDIAIGQAAAQFRAPTLFSSSPPVDDSSTPVHTGPNGGGAAVPPPVFDPPHQVPPGTADRVGVLGGPESGGTTLD